VTRITEFGDSGHPKKTEETDLFGDNRPKPLGSLAKNGISLEGITIFLEKISAKTPNPELLRSIPGEKLSGKNRYFPAHAGNFQKFPKFLTGVSDFFLKYRLAGAQNLKISIS
jgi:hypothetical protein